VKAIFKFKSIRQQLTVLISVVVISSLAIAAVFYYWSSYKSFKDRFANDMLAYTEMIGYNTQSSIVFNAAYELEELLPKLVTNQDIEIVCLVTPNRRVFHTWVRDNLRPKWIVIPAHPKNGFYQFKNGYIEVVLDSYLENELVSTVFVRASTDSFKHHMSRLVRSLILILLVASVFALFGAYFIAKLISSPVLSLAKLTNKISVDKDYSLRVDEGNFGQEMKILYSGFNNMLKVIETQNNEILIAFKEIYEQKNQIESQKHKIEEQQEILKEWNKDITSSIQYAKNIQTNMLVSIDVVKDVHRNLFVLFEPRDVVSGDFYWFEHIGDDFFFSAIDCTGHGVPGAMISVIGYNFLNQIVKERKVYEPHKILDALDKEIREFFRKDSEDVTSDDGMDIAIARLNLKSKKMQFAGAYNPAIIIHQEEVIELAADRQALGSVKSGEKSPFTLKEFQLQKDDCVYLFSDGYADQFGGPQGRKFLKKRFRKLLTEIAPLSVEEQQKILENTFFDWMGSNHQVDDVIVMGVKI
jgi:serine phosphatase RsbU (regulator of sigma subunit)